MMMLRQHIKYGTNLWLVTDGGASEGKGHFGWAIATDSEILTTNYGNAPGNPLLTESLRTESMGFLSIVRHSHHLCAHCNVTPSQDSLHYCDNESLMKRLSQVFSSKKKNPNALLKADCDVQLQIEQTLKTMKMNVTTTHVKGHQE